ncbi:MAG: SRPBCC domain-containing protein [Bacteroidota bacterium]
MPLHLQTDILIPASPAAVWAVLTDFARYPEWNPFVTKATGDWRAGSTVAITAGGMNFRPRVLTFQPQRELRWRGKLLMNGLFDGEHYWTLEERTPGHTFLTHGEHFNGALVPLFRKKLETATKAGFIAMNEALKVRVSAQSPPVAS